MKNRRIRTLLALGFALMLLLSIFSSPMIWMETAQSQSRANVPRHSATAAVALADPQSALWLLRHGLPPFMGGDVASNPTEWRAAISDLIELQQKASLANHEAGVQELLLTRRMTIGLSVVAVIAGMLLCWLITVSVAADRCNALTLTAGASSEWDFFKSTSM